MLRLALRLSPTLRLNACPNANVDAARFALSIRSATRASFVTMAQWKPNTDPPETVCVIKNIVKLASESDKFRRVLWTGRNSQLVIMTIPVGGEIGEVSTRAG